MAKLIILLFTFLLLLTSLVYADDPPEVRLRDLDLPPPRDKDGRQPLQADDRRYPGRNTILNKAHSEIAKDEVIIYDTNYVRSKEEVTNGFSARFEEIEKLYDKHLLSGLRFAGKIILKVKIKANGRVSEISIISSNTNNPKFDDEVKKRVKAWKWNRIEKGDVTVTVPFEFYLEIFPFLGKENLRKGRYD